jgi:hypothetical protein
VSIYATSLRLDLNGSAVVIRRARGNDEMSARAFHLTSDELADRPSASTTAEPAGLVGNATSGCKPSPSGLVDNAST